MTEYLSPLPSLPLGLYRHYKGPLYRVMGVVRHSETLEPLVLYQPLEGDGTIWVRPFKMFVETIEIHGQTQARFSFEAEN